MATIITIATANSIVFLLFYESGYVCSVPLNLPEPEKLVSGVKGAPCNVNGWYIVSIQHMLIR